MLQMRQPLLYWQILQVGKIEMSELRHGRLDQKIPVVMYIIPRIIIIQAAELYKNSQAYVNRILRSNHSLSQTVKNIS